MAIEFHCNFCNKLVRAPDIPDCFSDGDPVGNIARPESPFPLQNDLHFISQPFHSYIIGLVDEISFLGVRAGSHGTKGRIRTQKMVQK